MNSGMQCEAGVTPERILERLALGEDAQLTNLARLIGGLQGIADRLEEAQKFLFASNRWKGVSATLANENFGVMHGNITRTAAALKARYDEIANQNNDRRNKAAELLQSLPTAGVPSYVQDALNRNDVSVWTPFGTISLNEGAENLADFFGAKRSESASEKLSELDALMKSQSLVVKRGLGVDLAPVKLADGSSTGLPAPAPDPGTYTTTLPQYPGGDWRPPGGNWDGPDWPEGPDGPDGPSGPNDHENPDGPNDRENPDGPNDREDPDGPNDPRNPEDPRDPQNPGGPLDPENPLDPRDPGITNGPGGSGLGVGLAGGGLTAAGLAVGARFAGVGGFGGAGFGNAAGGLRGGAGLATGAGGTSASSAANSGAAGRSGGMMGAGGAGGGDDKKKRKEPGLGYIAPKYDDEGDNGPAADASRAGRRTD